MPKPDPDDDWSDDNHSRAIRIDNNQVSLPVLITGSLIFLSSAFQIGYFQELGIELISLTGPSDWLFSISLMILPYIFMEPIIHGIFRTVKTMIAENRYYSSWLFRSARFVTILPGIAVFLISTFVLIFGGQGMYFALRLTLFLSVLVLSVTILVEALAEQEITGEIRTASALKLAVVVGVLFLVSGQSYARYLAGSNCTIIGKDGRFDRGVYLRSVSEGHLMRMTNHKVTLFPKAEVAQLFCGSVR